MKRFKLAAIICLTFLILFGTAMIIRHKPKTAPVAPATTQQTESETQTQSTTVPPFDFAAAAQTLSGVEGREIPEELLTDLGEETCKALLEAASSGAPIGSEWHRLTGSTLNALLARAGEVIDGKWLIDLGSNGRESFQLGFVGDINFTEKGYVMTHAYTKPGVVADCIADEFKAEMKSVDIMLANNEFPYSSRGTPMPGKQYTFRSKPQNVKYLKELGVDIAALANNHAYDYGANAFEDTLSTLREAGISYVGAGMNYEEAARPLCFLINGYKVAYLAASRAEDYRLTPGAGENKAGVFECYEESDNLIKEIGKAAQSSDFVFVYVHWGIENSTRLSDNELRLGKKYIDAGASAVIGAHPHILQGMEFYKGAPIVYSLGNFWFNRRTLETGMLKLKIEKEQITMSFVPGMQKGSEVCWCKTAAEQRRIYDYIEKYSPNDGVKIDDNGVITAP